MFKNLLFIVCASILSAPLLTFASESTLPAISHVIYITVDGVRPSDVFEKKNSMPILWQKYAKDLTIYGQPNSDLPMQTASIPVSLPSYQTQMAGSVQPCKENDCGSIHVETFPEHLIKAGFNKADVATFASWRKIALAVEHVPGTTYTSIGNYPVVDPYTRKPDSEMKRINKLQAKNHPELDPEDGPERFDKYTFAQAMHYFEKYQPRFMWISLVDSDEAAHNGDKKAYYQALNFYDKSFDQIIRKIKELHLEKNTLVIMTTDHSRGNGKDWQEHGPLLPYTKNTWAFVYNGKLLPVNRGTDLSPYSTLSVRPTIEAALK